MKVTSSIRHIVLTAVFLLASGAASADNSSILVELNKLEDSNGACRAYLIVENKDTTKFEMWKSSSSGGWRSTRRRS